VHDPPSLEPDPELELLDVPELLDEVDVVDVPELDELELSAPELLDVVAPEELKLADAPELPDEAEEPEPVLPMMPEALLPGDAEHAATAARAHVSARDERALMNHHFFSLGKWRVDD